MRLFLLLLLTVLIGCSSGPKDKTLTWSVQKLYTEAKDSLNSGSYISAEEYYNKLLARYPFGVYAQQANIDLIVLYYKDKQYDKASAQADKVIQLSPNAEYTDYARYMKGVIAYSRDVSIIDKIVPTNLAKSDQSMKQNAFEDFNTLIEQSPDGKYSEDAKLRMRFLRNVSAEHEIYVAEYYLRRGAYIAAINRGQYVVENFAKTPSVELGLSVLVRAYAELGMLDLAADNLRVLNKNFPNNAADPRVDFILHGDITQKKGLIESTRQSLAN